MTVLEQLKLENPNLALLPDDELIDRLLLEYQGDLDPVAFRESLLSEPGVVSPVESPVAGGKRAFTPTESPSDIGFAQSFVGPAKSSWQRSWGPAITRLRGGIAGLMGNDEKSQQLYQQAAEQDRNILNQEGYVSFAQATEGPDAGPDTFVKAGLSAIGQSSPFLIEGSAAALAGARIGKIAGPGGAAIGALAGFGLSSFTRLFEFNLGRQQEQVNLGNLDSVNEAKAAATALPQAALETAMFPVVTRLFGPLSRTQFSNVINRATTGRVAKGTALGVTAEAATEVGQQALEMVQAGIPLDTPEAMAELKEAAFAGGFVGGAFGGAATLAGEVTRTAQAAPVQTPVESPAAKPVEAPTVEAGIIQPQEQKDRAKEEAAKEQAKPASFAVQQEGDKFVVKSQELDANNNVIKTDNQGVFNTEAEATAKQQEIQDQKNKLPEQTFFTADEIKTQDPTLGSIIDEVESQGAKISPGTKQVYYRKDLALPQGDLTNVMNSGGTAGSVADGWYDRTSDLAYISLSDLGKAKETVAHENFHALQRVTDRVSPNLFTEQEQTALDNLLPGGTIDSITPNVQKALGNDVMNTLRERHADRNISNREMQAYAFGAYATLRNNNKLLSAPNPVIRAFRKLFDFIKRAGNIFRKNKINDVKDIFDKARLGDIGKRAKTQPDVDALRTKSLAQAEKAATKGVVPTKFEYSITTKKYRGRDVGTVLPTLDNVYGTDIFEKIYNQAARKPQLKQEYIKQVRPEQRTAMSAVIDFGYQEKELIDDNGFLILSDDDGKTYRIGVQTGGRNASRDYTNQERTQIAKTFKDAMAIQQTRKAPTEFALSTVKFREKPPKKFKGIKALGKFFDDKVKKSDPLDKSAYNRALDAADKEIKYQLNKQDTGVGWYDTDVVEMFKDLQQKIPSLKTQDNKDLFTIIVGITSPQATPTENVVKAARVYSYYEKFGALAIKQPGNELNFGRTTITQQLSLLQYLLDTKGKEGTVDFLNSTHDVRDLDKVLQESGAAKYGSQFTDSKGRKLNYSADSKIAGAVRPRNQRNEVLGSYLFGNKIGSYYLNISGVADKEGDAVTKDLWAARSFYRQFGQVVDNTKSAQDGLKGAFLPIHRETGDKFFRELGKRNDLSAKDAQAVLWFYEHELFGDLGINNVPALYLSSGSKKYINNYDKGDNYGTVELENRKPGIEVKNRIGQKKETEETELSVSEVKQQAEDYEGNLEEAPKILQPELAIKANRIKQLPLKQIEEPNKSLVSSIEDFKNKLEKVASEDTAFVPATGNDYSEYVNAKIPGTKIKYGKLYNHCKACAVSVQEKFGGDIIYVKSMPFTKLDGEKTTVAHYINFINGHYFDISGQQFGNTDVLLPVDKLKGGNTEETFQTDDIRKKRKKSDRIRQFVELANGETKPAEPELSVQNLDELTPELSVSKDKRLLNPPGTKVTVDLARDLETLENFGIEPTDNVSEEIELLADKLFSRGIEDYGNLQVIEDTGLPIFVAGIKVDDVPVGFIQGAITGKIGFIDYVGLYREGQEYLSPIGFRRVGKQLAKLLGVKQFAGLRVTGARKEVQRRTDRLLDQSAISAEFSVSDLQNQVKKIDPSIKKNTETNVGKLIGGNLYVHKSAENVIDGLNKFKKRLPKDFTYDVVKFDKKENVTSFIKSPDFNTVAEPLATTGVRVPVTGPVKELKINQLYHHKWLFVPDNYKGFDVEDSIRRSLRWLPLRKEGKILDKKGWAAIGRPDTWSKVDAVLDKQSMAKTARPRGEGLALPEAKVLQYLDANIVKDEEVLSVGAGFANKEKELKDKGFKILAEDTKESGQAKRLKDAGLFKGFKEDFIRKGKKFDTVLLSNVINVQNKREATDELLNQVQQLLRPDGRLIVNLPDKPKNPGSPKTNAELRNILEQRYEQVETVRIKNKSQPNVFEAKNPRPATEFVQPELSVDTKLETDTLSKNKLREFNLEFAASTRKFSDGTQRLLDKINPKQSRKTVAAHWKDFTDNWGVKFQQGLSDQYISVKKFIGEDEYKSLTMTYGSSGATEAALLYGVPFMDNMGAIDLKDKTIGTGLFTRFEKLGQDLPDFLAWVAANRARNLVNKGFESGLGNINDINTAINELQKGKEKQFNESLKDLQEFNKAFLDIGVKSGYIDPASAKVWTEDNGYNFYIPFYRLLEDRDSNSGPRAAADIVNQPDYPRFRGADLPVNDLLQNIIRNYSFLTEASLKNAAGLKTLRKAAEMGVARRVPNKTKTSVFVRDKGKMEHYEVENKLVLESLTALNWNGWQNPAMNIMRNFKRYLTYGVTFSPAFRIRNLLRDSIHSVAVGKLKYNPIGNVLEGIKGLKKNKQLGASELRARMAFGGGSIHFGHIYGDDPNATKMLLDRAIDVNTVMKADGWASGARRVLGSKLRGGLKWWEETGSFFENVNRAALYQQLRAKGISHFEAAYQARDLLNFSRHGANPFVRFLTQSIPFLNARIQGLDKLGRAMTKEQRAQLLTVLGTYSLASIALYIAYKDDDDFKEREQWDRDTYHWFKLPSPTGEDFVFRLPRPFEVGAVGVIFERMVEQMVDDDVHGQLLAERILHVITETFAVDIRPQLITPALEVYSNKDSFTGRPIESLGMRRLPASERKYAYTSSSYVGASKILELIPFEKVQLSPVQIEHLVQGYFGWVGSAVVSAVSIVDYKRKYAEFFTTGFDSPLAMGFFKGLPSLQSKYKTQFYDMRRKMEEVNNLMRLYQKRGEYKKALELAEKNKNLLQWRASYNKVNTKITQINQEIRRIQADKNLVEAEKLDRTRQLSIVKNDMIQNLTEAVLSWEKSTGQKLKRPIWWK